MIAPLAVAVLVTVVLLTGLILGAAQWLILILFVALAAMLSIFLLGWRGFEDRRGWLVAGGWCGMLLSPMLNQISGVPIGYVIELVVFGLMVAAARGIRDLARRDRVFRWLLVLLGLHFSMALLSTLFGRSQPVAALWQLQYSLKWPLIFGLGALIVWNGRVDHTMRALIAWSWLWILPALALEIVLPTTHPQIFGPHIDVEVNPFFDAGSRLRGPFGQPGALAIVSALLAAGASVQLLAGRGGIWGLLALLYFAIVLASGQRQEFFALCVTLALVAGIHWRRYVYLLVVVAGLAGSIVVVGLIYFEHIPLQRTLAQWGVIDSVAPLSARAILTSKGVEVAQQFFPLGSGLGTYGGPGAQKHDLTLFMDLGFGRYYWFRQGRFLVDTYWPCIIAESGFFGALALFSFFMLMWGTLLRRAWHAVDTPAQGLSLLALAAMTLLLANTPSSQILTDPRGAIVFWLIIGAAWRATAPVGVETKPRPRRAPSVLTGGGLVGSGTGAAASG
jgi:hypothetical protein